MIDGKPQFPLGIYIALEPRWLDETVPRRVDQPGRAAVLGMLDDLACSPFNFLINYGDPDGSVQQIRQFLDELDRRGLRVFFSLKDYYPGKRPDVPQDADARRQMVVPMVRALKNHPAVVGWYLSDEPDDAAPVLQHGAWLGSEDPTKPALVVHNKYDPEFLKAAAPAAQIHAVDPYPVPRRPLVSVVEPLRRLRQAVGNARPAWFVLQAHGPYQYDEDIRQQRRAPRADEVIARRAPTPREMRCMAYLALANGASGLIFYYHRDIIEAVDAETRWPAVKALAREIKDLSPILFLPDFSQSIPSENAELHVLTKAGSNGRFYLIAANASERVQSCRLRVPVAARRALVRAGACQTYLHGSELALILDGHEGVVIELSAE
jgi:hypothetical protein